MKSAFLRQRVAMTRTFASAKRLSRACQRYARLSAAGEAIGSREHCIAAFAKSWNDLICRIAEKSAALTRAGQA